MPKSQLGRILRSNTIQKNLNDDVLVLDNKGMNLGRMPYQDAKREATNRNLDLVKVNKDDNGVVVFKIMDYGKYKYDQKKSKQKKVSHPLKEMKFKMWIDSHDIETKINQIKNFLLKGSDVKITVVMRRGRERASPYLAQEKLNSILEKLKDLVQVQQIKTTKESVSVTLKPLPRKKNEQSNTKPTGTDETKRIAQTGADETRRITPIRADGNGQTTRNQHHAADEKVNQINQSESQKTSANLQ